MLVANAVRRDEHRRHRGLSCADAECLASGALDAVEERPLVERFLELALTRHLERRAL